MPERTFGRMVRYRRTKLGLSQAKLGELVGRSPATIRSWERDQSQPTDTSVLTALSAVLGVEEKTVFEKAGQEFPAEGERETVEQALATLTPDDVIDLDEEARAPVISPDDFAPPPTPPPPSEHPVPVTSDLQASPNGASLDGYVEPSFSATPPPYYVTTAVPPAHEPSYMEDRTQRQLYRVRTLATVVFLVALGIALIWAFGEGWSAFSTWWDEFFGSLRL